MPTNGHQDERFHENLRVVGQRLDTPSAPSPELIARCRTILEKTSTPHWRQRLFMFRKPLAWSACGLAAAIVLAVTIWMPASPGSKAQAAMILSRLNAQIAAQPLLEITIDAMRTEEATVSGHLLIAGDAVAGDVNVSVRDGADAVDVDISLAVSPDNAWVLVRKLDVADARARALLSLFLPPGQETLVLLPSDMAGEGFDADFAEAIEEFRSGQVVQILQHLIATAEESGMNVSGQPDGKLLLTLPLDDEQAIQSLVNALEMFDHLEVGAQVGTSDGDEQQTPADDKNAISARIAGTQAKVVKRKNFKYSVKAGEDPDKATDAELLAGAIIHIVYDPNMEQVESLAIIGMGGSATLKLREGTIDPAWLDAARVTTPQTRTLDLATLAELFGTTAGKLVKEIDD